MTAIAEFCWPGLPCELPVPGLGGGLASHAAGAVFSALADSVRQSVAWLIDQVANAVLSTTSPDVAAPWFGPDVHRMEQILVLAVVPLLMVATISAVLRHDPRRLYRTWVVGLPVALIAGLAGPELASLALGATDGLCSVFTGSRGAEIGPRYVSALAAMGGYPVFLQLIFGLLSVLGGILLWLELVVREAAVYLTVFFMPLAFAAYVWPSTAGMTRRVLEILSSLVLSKLVIVAALVLGMDALGSHADLSGPVAGSAMLLVAAFTPFALLRLAPVVEAAAIGHLEGLAHRPGQIATRVASTAYPLVGAAMSARQPSGDRGPTPITAVPLPEHPVTYRMTAPEPADTDG